MIRWLYTVLLGLVAPLYWLMLARRARREGGDWALWSGERFGRYPQTRRAPDDAPVWVHAVSLGETRAAQPFLRALLDRGWPVLLTHTTATGRAEGGRLFAAELASGQLRQAWLPYDFPGMSRRFLQYFRPRCGVLIEREVWPNLVAQAHRVGVPLALVSARLSERSAAQLAKLGPLMRDGLAGIDLVLAQTDADAARLRRLGAHDPHTAGNLKFDLALPPAQLAQGTAWRRAWGRPVLLLASSRDGEEALFLQALARARVAGTVPPSLLLLVVPRHPQRFDTVAALVAAEGLSLMRRSQLGPLAEVADDVQVLLGDSVGEMPAYYAAADVAVVGGSFVPVGGHNLIEACAAGTPVLMGPNSWNFAQATADARAAGAALTVADADVALDVAFGLLADDARCLAMGAAGQAFIGAHQGAAERMASAVEMWLNTRTHA